MDPLKTWMLPKPLRLIWITQPVHTLFIFVIWVSYYFTTYSAHISVVFLSQVMLLELGHDIDTSSMLIMLEKRATELRNRTMIFHTGHENPQMAILQVTSIPLPPKEKKYLWKYNKLWLLNRWQLNIASSVFFSISSSLE